MRVSHAFAVLAAEPAAPVEELALAIASEFGCVDADAVRERLDALGAEVAAERGEGPDGDAAALTRVLGDRHGMQGDAAGNSDPRNEMIDSVLERGRGLPILLSAIYIAVASRAGIPLAGVGLPGHFVVAHLGADPPLLLDPYAGGGALPAPGRVRAWPAHAVALRMLNNLVHAFTARGDLRAAIRAAGLRLELPVEGEQREELAAEALALQARLN
jgi:hypothetical protein